MLRRLNVLLVMVLALFVRHTVAQPANTSGSITDIKDAWMQLWDDKSFSDRRLTIQHPREEADLNKVQTDNGQIGFSDKASSGKWQIPTGWMLVLHDDKNFKDTRLELIGTGKVEQNADFGSFSDKCSSFTWERKSN